jgi:acetyl esterase/lipase
LGSLFFSFILFVLRYNRPMIFSTRAWLVLTVVLAALPAIYADGSLTATERLEPGHLKTLHEARLQFERERQSLPNLGPYEDFRAVIHVHAEDSNHTKGTRAEVLAAAKKAGVRIVMFTDHAGPKDETWRGLRDGVLFIAGEENGSAGMLRFPAVEPKSTGGEELRFLSHIEERYDALGEGFAGMEISNRHTDAILDKSTEEVLRRSAADPESWRKLVKNFELYPDEVFAAGTDYRAQIFEKWDAETQKAPFTGIGANDAHQNQIFQGTTFDPYEVSFRNLSTHILARDLNEIEILQAMRDGHVYVSHDWLCDPTGFAFGSVNNLGVFPMGDPALMTKGTRLVGITPLRAKLKLFHAGKIIEETIGTNLVFTAKEPGAYRLEAWLHADGEDRPWIYSNPVYLRALSFADLHLPSMELSTNVELKKDIAYLADKADQPDPKQHLDVYIPSNAKGVPVFFFVHGGAWRAGDRAQYIPLGNRFAKDGIVTVIPSYRLAPKNRHPTQIEDVAAAFAWTVRHIAEFGGDTNRIYIGGHSAGGHLSALLALDDHYLAKHDLTTGIIRGVIPMSGVFDLSIGDGQAAVFGTDHQMRKQASPISHVKAPAPPFLITYCQWDYPTLPAQAREFDAALRRAGVQSELIFVRRESHISEMVNFPNAPNSTAEALVNFVKRNI